MVHSFQFAGNQAATKIKKESNPASGLRFRAVIRKYPSFLEAVAFGKRFLYRAEKLFRPRCESNPRKIDRSDAPEKVALFIWSVGKGLTGADLQTLSALTPSSSRIRRP
jgi:hypothetical protein